MSFASRSKGCIKLIFPDLKRLTDEKGNAFYQVTYLREKLRGKKSNKVLFIFLNNNRII
jgi:hypothetical protein